MSLTKIALLTAVLSAAAWAQPAALPMEPPRDSGQSVTGGYEGWFKNADGSYTLLVGYYNRNQKTSIDIPIGPDNKIEPGGPDFGQPVHFLPGRQWGMFSIRVPADFGEKKLIWTITANGKTTQVPLSLNLLWEVEPFKDANGNAPPYLSFREGGPFRNGPVAEAEMLTATVGEPLNLPIWFAEDEKLAPGARRPQTPSVLVSWSQFRGSGDVTFSEARPHAEKGELKNAPAGSLFTGKAMSAATFTTPGEYTLRVQLNDWSGEGGRGFQCCWSSALVKVAVKPAAAK